MIDRQRKKASPVTLTMPAQTAVDLRRALHWRIQDIQHTISKIPTEWSPEAVPQTLQTELR